MNPAAEEYSVERTMGESLGRRHLGARALGTAVTGFPMPSSKPAFEATVRILDRAGSVVFERYGVSKEMDELELRILRDLMQLDVEAFRRRYDLREEPQG